MTERPVDILGGNEYALEAIRKIYGKKPCVKQIWKLELRREENKRAYKYVYKRVCYLAEVCPYLGLHMPFRITSPEDVKPYCAGGYKGGDDCLKVWKNGIPYVLRLVYEYEKLEDKKQIVPRGWW